MAKEFAKVSMVEGRGSTPAKVFASVLHTLNAHSSHLQSGAEQTKEGG